jgi:hypothetical protein
MVLSDSHHTLPVDPIHVTIPVACAIFGYSRTVLYRELGAGKIQAVKSGTRVLLDFASLKARAAQRPPAKIAPDIRRKRKGA